MRKDLCKDIVEKFREYSKISDKYVIQYFNKPIAKFHRWVDGEEILGMFLINEKNSSEKYYFIFIDWKSKGENYYLVIYPETRSCTLIEIHKVKDELYFTWRYSPCKQDGKNEERKHYFEVNCGELESKINIPRNYKDVEAFIGNVIDLAIKRHKADLLY